MSLNPQKLAQTTKLQQEASNPNNCVFVSASAGSGKTKILTDRVLRLLLDGISPNKILCLTFTKVAAFEMQHRIYQELSNWNILEDEELKIKIFQLIGSSPTNNQINKARTLFNVILDDFEGIKINTIHSFCQNLITKFPVESNIKPNFKIIDSKTENKLLLESKNNLLQEALINENLAQKIKFISSNLNENSFLEIILELINKRTDLEITKDNFLGIENLNQFIIKILNCENLDENKIGNLIQNPNNLDENNIIKIANLAQENNKSKTDPLNSKLILDYFNDKNEDNFNNYLKAFLTQKNEPKKNVFTKKIKESFEDYEEIIKNEQKRLLNLIEITNSFHIAKLTTNLLEVGNKMLEIYFSLKSKNNYLDYNDLITKTSKLLTNKANSSWIKYKLDGSIEHILVDESQDTNNNQWTIIKAISEDFFNEKDEENKKTIFVVGDDKQSIFNFQGAQPKIFSNVLKYYQKQLNLVNEDIKNISLNNSFRSLSTILEVVDNTFRDPKYKSAISPINLINHSAVRTNGIGKVEVWPIINISKENKRDKNDFSWELDFNPNEIHNSKEVLAKIIAKKIKLWIENKRIIKSENRAIQAKDIMILLKNRTNNLGNLIIKNLQKEGIAISGNDKIALTQNIIVKDLLSLAKFLLLNEDDLNLATLLKSPILELSENDLFELCEEKNQKQISLYSTLRNSNKIHIKQCFLFLEEVKEYYKNNPYKIYELFLHILNFKKKKEKIISHFGKESIEIINHFLNLCLSFEENEIASLENFVISLENAKDSIKIDTNNNFNEVKITTIHSSKGLESPIIILADSAHDNKGKYGANNNRILWLNKDDIKIPLWAAGKDNKLIDEIKENERNIQYDEYLRLLYVAMTRAKAELYVTGFGKNIADDCWYNIIKNNGLTTHNSKESNFNKIIDIKEDIFLNDDKILFMGDDSQIEEQTNNIKEKGKSIKFEIPDFLNQINIIEKTQNIIHPSKQKEDLEQETKVGKNNIGSIIHKILEILPKNNFNEELLNNYLKNHYNYLQECEKLEIIRQTNNIFNSTKFDFIFANNSKSEIPVFGTVNNQLISGKIDRIIIKEDEIIIIDYKSDKIKFEDIELKSKKYQSQLDLYCKIIAEIYPNKTVKKAIIWTFLGEISFL